MIALIDGDVIVYRVGFASDNQSEAQNCFNAELVMQDILTAVEADSYKVFLSDKLENNFRYAIDNTYKANRKNSLKPKWYESIRSFLRNEYQAEFTPGQEADDALGIVQSSSDVPTVICSIDKDLLQIAGRHYNLSTGAHTTVQPLEGLRHFYRQLLIGDRVDNITGVRGIGPVKAGHIISDELHKEHEMFERVRGLYGDDERLLKNGRLLWVRRKEGETWCFPRGVETGMAGNSGFETGLGREQDSQKDS